MLKVSAVLSQLTEEHDIKLMRKAWYENEMKQNTICMRRNFRDFMRSMRIHADEVCREVLLCELHAQSCFISLFKYKVNIKILSA